MNFWIIWPRFPCKIKILLMLSCYMCRLIWGALISLAEINSIAGECYVSIYTNIFNGLSNFFFSFLHVLHISYVSSLLFYIYYYCYEWFTPNIFLIHTFLINNWFNRFPPKKKKNSISVISTRWQSWAHPFVNPLRVQVTIKTVSGRSSKLLKGQGQKRFFCKPDRKMNLSLWNYSIYAAVNH